MHLTSQQIKDVIKKLWPQTTPLTELSREDQEMVVEIAEGLFASSDGPGSPTTPTSGTT